MWAIGTCFGVGLTIHSDALCWSNSGCRFLCCCRGGFFSPQATVKEISPFGFAALAGLVGLFSDQALEKLKQLATTMLAGAKRQGPRAATLAGSESNRGDERGLELTRRERSEK